MKLESSLKHFSPQGMHISDSVKSTSPDRLTGTDVMAAIGTTSNRARFGLAAFFGKAGVSEADKHRAVLALAEYARDIAGKNIRKAAGKEFGECMLIMARFAFAEYSRSAATSTTCTRCGGSGFTYHCIETVKYPGLNGVDGRVIVPKKTRTESVKRMCVACNGKGEVKARCRCGGSGEVLDRKSTKERGVPVFKVCDRCNGNGYSPIPSTAAYKAISTRLPDLHVRTWTRNWKPLLEMLVDVCDKGERQADREFQSVTTSGEM